MDNQAIILRELAKRYAEIANAPRNDERRKLHTASNDLEMIRPVVLIDELPWNEMDIDDQLKLSSINPFLRTVEDYMRKTLFKYKYLPADMIVMPYLPVNKIIHHSDNGIKVTEDTIATNENNHIISHDYKDQFESDDSISIIKDVTVTYDENATMRNFELLSEIIGDIIPIKLKGIDHNSVATWDDISRYRGVTSLLIDLVDRPEFSHKLVDRLTQLAESKLTQYENLGLFDEDPQLLHCTPILTKSLPSKGHIKGSPMTRKDIWGRGTAQIFASVGKACHEEFDIDYMLRTVGTCGLSYYGCCEPLDRKIDIVEKLPNLRKISITPWADVNIAAEAIGKKYVLSSKPNPSSVAVGTLDKDALKKEIGTILDACKRNSCSVDIVLKDISTCGFRPQNIFEWEQIVMDMVNNY